MAKRKYNSNNFELVESKELGACLVERAEPQNLFEKDSRFEEFDLNSEEYANYKWKKIGGRQWFVDKDKFELYQQKVKSEQEQQKKGKSSMKNVNQAQREIEDWEELAEVLLEERDSLNEEKASLNEELGRLTAEQNALEREILKAWTELESARSGEKTAKEKVKDWERTFWDTHKSKIAAKEAEIKKLSDEKAALTATRSDAVKRAYKIASGQVRAQTRTAIKDATKKMDTALASAKTAEERAKAAESALVDLCAAKRVLEGELTRLGVIEDKNKKIAKQNEIIKELKELNKSDKEAFNKLKAKYIGLHKEYTGTKKKLSNEQKSKKKIIKGIVIGGVVIALAAVVTVKAFDWILDKASQKDTENKNTIEDMENADINTLLGAIEQKESIEVLGYNKLAVNEENSEDKVSMLRVYGRTNENVSTYLINLPEEANLSSKQSLENMAAQIKSGEIQINKEFEISRNNEDKISIDGVSYNLNGTKKSPELAKYVIKEGTTEDFENAVFAISTTPRIEDSVDVKTGEGSGKLVTVDIFTGSEDTQDKGSYIQRRQFMSDREYEALKDNETGLIEWVFKNYDGKIDDKVEEFCNFFPELNVTTPTNDRIDTIEDYDAAEVKKLNIQLRAEGVLEINESVVQKVTEAGDTAYYRVTDKNGNDSIYAVAYKDGKINKDVATEKYVSLDAYTKDADARDVIFYSITGGEFDKLGSDEQTIYISSKLTKEDGVNKGSLDALCVGYSSENPKVFAANDMIKAESKSKISVQDLVDAVVAKVNNRKGTISGKVEYNFNGVEIEAINSESEVNAFADYTQSDINGDRIR